MSTIIFLLLATVISGARSFQPKKPIELSSISKARASQFRIQGPWEAAPFAATTTKLSASVPKPPSLQSFSIADFLSQTPLKAFYGGSSPTNSPASAIESVSIAQGFLQEWNAGRIDTAMDLIMDDKGDTENHVILQDTAYPRPFTGKEEVERILRLQVDSRPIDCDSQENLVVDGVADDATRLKVGVFFHLERTTAEAGTVVGKKGMAFFDLDEESELISKIFLVMEGDKGGEANLRTLQAASKVIETFSLDGQSSDNNDTALDVEIPEKMDFTEMTLPEKYFAAWNERDMKKAVDVFSDDLEYDDTAFPEPFRGKEALANHLDICAGCFPPTFTFTVDDIACSNGKNGEETIAVLWHVENNGKTLPFTRGSSFYELRKGKICKGTDFVEPSGIKTGGLALLTKSMNSKLSTEPVRFVPLATWMTYMYVVFFSDWFFGLPATALEQRTWEEVLNLSLNFFLVSPILNLPFAPVVHPMLEGTFNLLLSWAALFAGFLSDDRREKPNLIPMLPMVAGMQFLTSAFLLPYLLTRSNEKEDSLSEVIYKEDLEVVAQVTESRALAPFLTFVGTGSIFWGIFARADDFGPLSERLPSFFELLSIDRVGSSFLVDLAIFALFQGWLVEDDAKRRGLNSDSILANLAKYVPFFGMAAYLTFRPALPTREGTGSSQT